MSDDDSIVPPDVAQWLRFYLDDKRDEYESQFHDVSWSDDPVLSAIKEISRHAELLITTGQLPGSLAESLADFLPGTANAEKLRDLLVRSVVQHRLELDVADTAVSRLDGVSARVLNATLISVLLFGHGGGPRATSYLRRAMDLYLAGYEPESVILCGAVLEAAFNARFPDDLLLARNWRPTFWKEGVFSMAQRMKYERSIEPCLTDAQRACADAVNIARNQTVHQTLDLAPKALLVLAQLAAVLPALLPESKGQSE